MRLRHWFSIHREGIISLAVIILILAGLFIIWGGDGGDDEENGGPGYVEALWIPDVIVGGKSHDDLAAERTLWEQASYDRTTTTQRATRSVGSGKTRSRIPKAKGGGEGGYATPATKHCESKGNYQAISPSGKYRGAWQFDQRTWDAYADEEYRGTDPAAAPPSVQDDAARRVPYDAWPNC